MPKRWKRERASLFVFWSDTLSPAVLFASCRHSTTVKLYNRGSSRLWKVSKQPRRGLLWSWVECSTSSPGAGDTARCSGKRRRARALSATTIWSLIVFLYLRLHNTRLPVSIQAGAEAKLTSTRRVGWMFVFVLRGTFRMRARVTGEWARASVVEREPDFQLFFCLA